MHDMERFRGQCEAIPAVLTIDLLNAPPVVLRQLEVLRLHPLVKGSHDGQRVVGVLQTQSVAQFVHGHQEEVVAWRGGGLKESVDGNLHEQLQRTLRPAAYVTCLIRFHFGVEQG